MTKEFQFLAAPEANVFLQYDSFRFPRFDGRRNYRP